MGGSSSSGKYGKGENVVQNGNGNGAGADDADADADDNVMEEKDRPLTRSSPRKSSRHKTENGGNPNPDSYS